MSAAAYGKNAPQRWTRIEMLLSLYRETISELDKVLEAEPNTHEMFRHRLRTLSLISAIESGVDKQYGDVPKNVLRLCQFVRDSLVSCERNRLECCLKVMQELYEGFAAIRVQAVNLERCGEIPEIDRCPTIDLDI